MYFSIFRTVMKNSDMHKCCVFVVMFFLFIFFQLCCCLKVCEMRFILKNEMIEWWFESFSSSVFILHWIIHCVNHENVKIRLSMIINLHVFHVIVSDSVSNYSFIFLTNFTRSSVMQYLIRHLTSFHHEWCRLKSLITRCSSDLLNNDNST